MSQTPKAQPPADAESVLGPIDPALREINEKLGRARAAGWNVLAPAEFTERVPFFKPVLQKVLVSTDLKDKDIYDERRGRKVGSQWIDLFALSRRSLIRIADAFGVDWDHSRSGRVDDGRDEMRVEYRAAARVLGWDGRWRDLVATYELDIRARDAELREKKIKEAAKKNQKLTDEQLEEMIRGERLQLLNHKVSRAESGAMARLVAALGVNRGGYTLEELKKPFLVARLAVDVGEDIDAKHMLLSAALKVSGELFGGARNPPHPPRGELRAMPAHAELPEHEDYDSGDEAAAQESDPEPQRSSADPTVPTAASPPQNSVDPAFPTAAVPATTSSQDPPPEGFADLPHDRQLALVRQLADAKGFDISRLPTAVEKMQGIPLRKLYEHLAAKRA